MIAIEKQLVPQTSVDTVPEGERVAIAAPTGSFETAGL
jgi:hypothetical protein